MGDHGAVEQKILPITLVVEFSFFNALDIKTLMKLIKSLWRINTIAMHFGATLYNNQLPKCMATVSTHQINKAKF